MNLKMVFLLAFCVFALAFSPIAILVATNIVALPGIKTENVAHLTSVLSYKPCGDDIDTPGYPT